jgi:hypothetical protein
VKIARDTWLIFQRQMLLVGRSPIQIAFSIAQPITYLLLFAPMLKLALNVTTYTAAYRIYVPGHLPDGHPRRTVHWLRPARRDALRDHRAGQGDSG